MTSKTGTECDRARCPTNLEDTSLFPMGAIVGSREVGLVGRKAQGRGFVGGKGIVHASVQSRQQLFLFASRSAGSEDLVEVDPH